MKRERSGSSPADIKDTDMGSAAASGPSLADIQRLFPAATRVGAPPSDAYAHEARREKSFRSDKRTWLYRWRHTPLDAHVLSQKRHYGRLVQLVQAKYPGTKAQLELFCNAFDPVSVPSYNAAAGGLFVLDSNPSYGTIVEDVSGSLPYTVPGMPGPPRRFLDYLVPKLQSRLQTHFEAFCEVLDAALATPPPQRALETHEPRTARTAIDARLSDFARPSKRPLVQAQSDGSFIVSRLKSTRAHVRAADIEPTASDGGCGLFVATCAADRLKNAQYAREMMRRLLGFSGDDDGADPLEIACTSLFDLTLGERTDADTKRGLAARLAQLVNDDSKPADVKFALFWDEASKRGVAALLLQRGFHDYDSSRK